MIFTLGYSYAQDVTIINRFEGDSATGNVEDYVLRDVEERTVIVNRFERVDNNPANRVRDLIEYSVRSYLETAFAIKDGEVSARKDPDRVSEDLKNVVRNALWLFEYEFADEFPGFSGQFESRLQEMRKWNGYPVNFGREAPGNGGDNEVGFFYYQKLGLGAKERAMQEVESFLKPRIGERKPTGFMSSVQPPDENKQPGEPGFLQPIDYQLDPIDENDDKLEGLTLSGPGFEEEQAVNDTGGSDPYGAKIVELLEENNRILARYDRRFDDLQGQIDEIKEQGPDPQLRAEVKELRKMVEALREGKVVEDPSGSQTKKLDLRSIQLQFAKNAHDLDWDHKARLNQVKETLIKNPSFKLLITGYADKSGNSEYNIYLSEQRAESVKEYLRSSGIKSNRLIVNYFGDTRSEAVGPQDRKVELEWLTDVSYGSSP